jgi:hypothetical protein
MTAPTAADYARVLEFGGPETATRWRMAAEGIALPDGSYPIPTVNFLRRAIKAWGRCPPAKRRS